MAPRQRQTEPGNAYSSPVRSRVAAVCLSSDCGLLLSSQVAFIYIFNLIVGFGILTLPKAFSEAGYVFGVVLLAWLGFMRSDISLPSITLLSLTLLSTYFHPSHLSLTVSLILSAMSLLRM